MPHKEKPDQNLVLMQAMGARGYDPLPIDHRRYLSVRGETTRIRLLAWMWSKTIALGHKSPYAVDVEGRPLTIKHMAVDCGWQIGHAQQYWSDAVREGLVRLDEENRMSLCGAVSLAELEKGEIKAKKSCTGLYSPFVRRQLARLSEADRAAFETARDAAAGWKLEAEAIAEARRIREQVEHNIAARYGIKLREGKKQRDMENRTLALALVSVPSPVQDFCPAPSGELLYTPANGHVQDSSSLLSLPLTPTPSNTVGRSVDPVPTDRPASPFPQSKMDEVAGALIMTLSGRLNDMPRRELCITILENLRGAPLEDLQDRIRERFKSIQSYGMVALLADDVGHAYVLRKAELERKKAKRAQSDKSLDEHLAEAAGQ